MALYERTKHKKRGMGDEPVLFWCKDDNNIEPGGTCGPIIRDTYIIECHTEGYGTYTVNGHSFDLKPGDCYATLPGQLTYLTSDVEHPRRGYFCLLGGARVGEILTKAGISEKNPFAKPGVCECAVEVIKKMLVIRDETGACAELMKTAYVYELLSAFMIGKNATDEKAWLEKAIGLFEAGYQDELSVEEVANAVGFDRSYFSMIFKEHMGIPPHKYLTGIRIDKACKLLCETNTPISEISESVGIEPSNFARTFKAELGISPTVYRRRNSKK